MKRFFYIGAILIILFEIANIFFIMPIPGSQEMETIGLAYFLFTWKWSFRLLGALLMLAGFKDAWNGSRVLTIVMLAFLAVVIYMTNFRMKAETMFYEPKEVRMEHSTENKVDGDKLVLGVEHNGEAAAFPINFLAYHHKVHDTIGGKPIMATYCSVCRTGRVFEPIINGKKEIFRLVGMDHYNAMFEDATTKSWWRQVNGEAVAGELKGQKLPEYPSIQTTLNEWLKLYPQSLVMQPDTNFHEEYDSLVDFETGMRKGRLEKRDTIAWNDKAWIAGVEFENESKAYDWNDLIEKQIINDLISSEPIVLFVASDKKSLFAFHRLYPTQQFSITNDTLTGGAVRYDLLGHALRDSSANLQPLKVRQEYWHSWRTFHPGTLR